MTDPFQTILQSGNLTTNQFPVTSRYHAVGTATLETNKDKYIIYLKRRFIPPFEKLELIRHHVVKEGDRPDNITALYIGDPEQFWQVADANNSMKPEELTDVPGITLRITQPEGIRTF